MDTTVPIQPKLDEIRLGDLLRVAWQRKWLILCVTLAFGIAGAILVVVVPKKYSASIIVDPVTNSPNLQSMGGFGAIASELGGLASLAGLKLPQESSTRAETIAVLESRALTERFIADNNLLPLLYPRRWNAKTEHWRDSYKHDIPTLWMANRYFQSKVREVTTDPKTDLVTLTIRWSNPQLAAAWANALVGMANDYLRQKAIDESDRNVSYLTQQATKTDDVGIKQAIYMLLQSEISKAMLARGQQQYALKILDPAQAPERPSSPKPFLWIAASLFVGAFVSFLLALLQSDAPGQHDTMRSISNAT